MYLIYTCECSPFGALNNTCALMVQNVNCVFQILVLLCVHDERTSCYESVNKHVHWDLNLLQKYINKLNIAQISLVIILNV